GHCLPSTAEHSQCFHVGTSEQAGSYGRRRCGPKIGEPVGLHARQRAPRDRIYQFVGCKNAGLRANGDSLHAGELKFAVIARHEEQDGAAGKLKRGAYRHAQGLWVVAGEGRANGANYRISISKLANLFFRDEKHAGYWFFGPWLLAFGSCLLVSICPGDLRPTPSLEIHS